MKKLIGIIIGGLCVCGVAGFLFLRNTDNTSKAASIK